MASKILKRQGLGSLEGVIKRELGSCFFLLKYSSSKFSDNSINNGDNHKNVLLRARDGSNGMLLLGKNLQSGRLEGMDDSEAR